MPSSPITPDLAGRYRPPGQSRCDRPTQGGRRARSPRCLKESSHAEPVLESRLLDGQPHGRHQPPAEPLRPAGVSQPVPGQAGALPPDPHRGEERRAESAADAAGGQSRHRGSARQAQDALLRRAPHPARRCGAARGSPGAARLRIGNRTGDRGRRHGPPSGDDAQQARHHAGTPAHGCPERHHPRCRRLDALQPLRRVRYRAQDDQLRLATTAPTSARSASIPWRTSRRTCAASS
jgi:hypothetical protein